MLINNVTELRIGGLVMILKIMVGSFFVGFVTILLCCGDKVRLISDVFVIYSKI